MQTYEERAARFYSACERAGGTPRELQVMRLRLSGLSQPDIALSLGISQPTVFILLARLRHRVFELALSVDVDARREVTLPDGFDRLLDFYRWLWHTICADIHEDGVTGGWRKATIGAGPAFDPLTDHNGDPVHFRVRPYRPEDSVEEAQAVVEGR